MGREPTKLGTSGTNNRSEQQPAIVRPVYKTRSNFYSSLDDGAGSGGAKEDSDEAVAALGGDWGRDTGNKHTAGGSVSTSGDSGDSSK